ncbi:MAG: hypothetical protein FJ225_03595 [Lentisphaerae bacterium]|nr:hypothetical protein [Lentisphaerota bacterium]
MGIRFNADEVLQMAIRAEQEAVAFYRKAADRHASEADCSFLLKLADMEKEHERIFAAMRRELGEGAREETAFDPDNEAALYLGAMVDGAGIEGAPRAAAALTGRESLRDILKIGLQMEKNAVLFYQGFLDMVPAKLGGDWLRKIIDEEKKHIVAFVRELRKLG